MKEFGFMRHGFKLGVGEERPPLEQSGLTEEDQATWQEAVASLHLKRDPEITYETLPRIRERAQEIYNSLPERATVVLTSTDSPRSRLTADFLSSSIIKLVATHGDKEVGVAFLWEPPTEAQREDSLTNIMNIKKEADKITKGMVKVAAREYGNDPKLAEYFRHSTGSRAHALENEIVMKAVNEDLASDHSIFLERIPMLRKQLRNLQETFRASEGPIYFIGVGHHSNLIGLDVALNGRRQYESPEEIPNPLSLWKVDKDAISRFLEEEHE